MWVVPDTVQRRMKLLELFAGSRSVGRIASRMGMNVCSVDVKPFAHIGLVRDVEFLRPEEIPFAPDVIWASPPCTTFSLAAISHHRFPYGTPRTDFAAKSDRLVKNTIALIQAFPDAVWYMENPRATLRNMAYMQALPKPVTVWYCRYGDDRAKPTDIWTNNLASLMQPDGWHPRAECWNGNLGCGHELAPRGAKTGTQGRANDYERSRIPEMLCAECIGAALNTVGQRATVPTF